MPSRNFNNLQFQLDSTEVNHLRPIVNKTNRGSPRQSLARLVPRELWTRLVGIVEIERIDGTHSGQAKGAKRVQLGQREPLRQVPTLPAHVSQLPTLRFPVTVLVLDDGVFLRTNEGTAQAVREY